MTVHGQLFWPLLSVGNPLVSDSLQKTKPKLPDETTATDTLTEVTLTTLKSVDSKVTTFDESLVSKALG